MSRNVEEGDVEQLLNSLADGKKQIIESIYKDYFPRVEAFVKRNSGSHEEARDLFQESMFMMFQFSRKPNRSKIENFDSYFFGICRNRWYAFLAREKRRTEIERDTNADTGTDSDLHHYIYLKAFEKLGDDCKKVLKYYIEGKSTEELAHLLNTSMDYAKRKKYLCKEKLKTIALEVLKVYERES